MFATLKKHLGFLQGPRRRRFVRAQVGSHFYANWQSCVAEIPGRFWLNSFLLTFVTGAALTLLLPKASFAETGGGTGIDTTQIQASVTALTGLIQQLSGIFLVLLMMAGAGMLMWGGFSENLRRRGLQGITMAICGAAIVFLFATPLASFFVSTFQAGAGGGTAGG